MSTELMRCEVKCMNSKDGPFVTRIDSDLAAQVDKLVEEGIFNSRSDAVGQALATMV